MKAHGDAARLTPALRNAIWSVDKDEPILRVAPMDGLVAASAAARLFALTLFESFALRTLAPNLITQGDDPSGGARHANYKSSERFLHSIDDVVNSPTNKSESVRCSSWNHSLFSRATNK